MIITPRYAGPAILTMDGDGHDGLAPIIRQYRRFAAMLAGFDDAAWSASSRCDGWSTRDVAAHLLSVNRFWKASVVAGLSGQPSTILKGFDPAKTPPAIVDTMAGLSNRDILEQFQSASQGLLDVLAGLAPNDWSALAESPAGHVPIRFIVHHALWDSWVHERDVAVPLDLAVPDEDDEVTICLRYAAAIGPVLGLSASNSTPGRFAVEATGPTVRFVVSVDVETVSVYTADSDDSLPTLRGSAVHLTEALSLRTPPPLTMPHEWTQLLDGLRTAFDSQ